MKEKIFEDEEAFFECWYNPLCMAECLFDNFDGLNNFSEDKLGHIRPYQIPLLSYEGLVDFDADKKVTKKERFRRRKRVGDLFVYGSRRFGKSLIVLKLNIVLSMLYDDNLSTACSSADSIHVNGILDDVRKGIEYHPILSKWLVKIVKSPNWNITARNNWSLVGINQNIGSKQPGQNWFGKHVHKAFLEEQSLENQEAYNNRKDAISELGCVYQIASMTNFTKLSPAGEIFFNPENRVNTINLPQFANPLFDEKEHLAKIKEHSGEESLQYKVFVKGEIVEDGITEFDSERLNRCYMLKRSIKRFEITKKNFSFFENLIVVERPKNCNSLYVAADVGDGAGGSELIVISEKDDIYRYLYNITLYNLKESEQIQIFKYLIRQLEADVVGIDCGDALGRGLADHVEKIIGSENVVKYQGTRKVQIGFQEDERGKPIIKNGKALLKEEYMSEWSVRCLKNIIYEEKIQIPVDYKLDKQLNYVVSTQSGNRRIYACVCPDGDHLFDAFRVFALTQWQVKTNLKPRRISSDWCVGVI